MPDTVQDLLDRVRTEAGFDATETQALAWLNQKWLYMTTEALAYRKTVSVGTTVANQAFYPFAPVKAYSFEVAGVPYGKARRPDVHANAKGGLWLSGDGGLILGDADANGQRGITLVPTPSEAGLAITSFAAMAPARLSNDPAGNALLLAVLEDQYSDGLVAGAIGTGLKRVRRRPDLAAPYEQEFMGETERLRVRSRQRFRGQGPAQIRILGVNA